MVPIRTLLERNPNLPMSLFRQRLLVRLVAAHAASPEFKDLIGR
jgi:hypothetical protein